MKADRKKVWGYCRQSVPGNAYIEAQKFRINQYAQSHGYELAGYTVVNGARLENNGPEMEELRNAAEKMQVNTLIICSADRLSKSYDEMMESVKSISQFGMHMESIKDDYYEIPHTMHSIFTTMTEVMNPSNQEDGTGYEDDCDFGYDEDEV